MTLITFLFNSCAFFSTSPVDNRKIQLKDSLGSICLSGEGRGKLHYKKARYAFDFESLLDRIKKNWTLALHIHLYGEEKFQLSWVKEIKSEGGLFAKIAKWKAKGRNQENPLEHLSDHLGRFLRFYGNNQWKRKKNNPCLVKKRSEEEIRGSCQDSSFRFTWIAQKDQFVVIFPKKNDAVLRIVFLGWGGHFKKIRLSLKKDRKSLLNMSLILSQCYES